ncbi:MAG: S1C family serine protease, partial [Flavobacteriales bacterium]
ETQLKVHNLTPKDSLTEEGAGTFVEGEVQRFAATAFAVNDSGYLVTSFHVLKGARSIEVEIKSDSTRSFHTEMIAGSDTLDLALLKITDQKFKGWAATVPYVFSDAESVLGERVFTLGFPRDDFIYGEGSVSALTGFDQDSLAYQVSIPVNPGNSGAPLINDRGEVSGVITAKNSGEEGASFAIKSGCFLRFMNALNADSTIAPVHLPSRNRLRWLNRTQQVERCKDFVFILKVTCPK